jgi:hypothetical protein
MMGWTLAILFAVAIVLFILSFIKAEQSSKQLEKQIDHITFSFTDEMNKMKEQIRSLEFDAEIIAQEAGLCLDRDLLRDVLDMHRRGYSIESIAEKKQLTAAEIESLLTPYTSSKNEGGQMADVG